VSNAESLDRMISASRALTTETHGALAEIGNLRAIKEWAIKSLRLDYVPGDRVRLVAPPRISKHHNPGWLGYIDVLVPGARGTAGEIRFQTFGSRWMCDFRMEIPDRGSRTFCLPVHSIAHIGPRFDASGLPVDEREHA
jgi:hypothetical protein